MKPITIKELKEELKHHPEDLLLRKVVLEAVDPCNNPDDDGVLNPYIIVEFE